MFAIKSNIRLITLSLLCTLLSQNANSITRYSNLVQSRELNSIQRIQNRNQAMIARIQSRDQTSSRSKYSISEISVNYQNLISRQLERQWRLSETQQSLKLNAQRNQLELNNKLLQTNLRIQEQQMRIQERQISASLRRQEQQFNIIDRQREMMFKLQMQQQRIQDRQREMMFRLQDQQQRIQAKQTEMMLRIQAQQQRIQVKQQEIMFKQQYQQQEIIARLQNKIRIDAFNSSTSSIANSFAALLLEKTVLKNFSSTIQARALATSDILSLIPAGIDLFKLYQIGQGKMSPYEAPFHFGWTVRLYSSLTADPFRNMSVTSRYSNIGGSTSFSWQARKLWP